MPNRICDFSVAKLKTNKVVVVVSELEEGLRLDKYISTLEEISSRSYAKNLITKGSVTQNGKPLKPSYEVKVGQKIELELPEISQTDLVPFEFNLDILFEDADLIVVNKPSGLVVHPAAGHQQDTLVNALLFHTKELSLKNEMRPGIVHRIDKETSGLLVVAKNDFCHENLAAQFKAKTTHRVYYALVQGGVLKSNGTIKSYLARHLRDRKKYASVKEDGKVITSEHSGVLGKWAVTHFTTIAQKSQMSYLKIKLETGRTHQIRVHLSEMGHCLVGDLNYGYSAKKYKELTLNRFFLHAAELGFTHPRSGENMVFKCSWPVENLNWLKNMGFSDDELTK